MPAAYKNIRCIIYLKSHLQVVYFKGVASVCNKYVFGDIRAIESDRFSLFGGIFGYSLNGKH